jgi:hypothetical protein
MRFTTHGNGGQTSFNSGGVWLGYMILSNLVRGREGIDRPSHERKRYVLVRMCSDVDHELPARQVDFCSGKDLKLLWREIFHLLVEMLELELVE